MNAASPHIDPPLAMLIELTYRCPLRCPYCSNPLEMTAASGEMDTGQWLGVIEEAADMGVLQIHFSGGEPTVRQDLEDMVGRAEVLGIYTNLITSGVLIDQARLEGLAETLGQMGGPRIGPAMTNMMQAMPRSITLHALVLFSTGESIFAP